MNAVIDAIMSGHFQKEIIDDKTKQKRLVCRICADDMPCRVILDARAKVNRQYGKLQPAQSK